MTSQKIKCPKCDFEFLPDEVLSHQLEEKYRLEYEAKQKQKDLEITEKEKELTEKFQKIEAAKQDLVGVVNRQVEEKLKTEKLEIEKTAREKAIETVRLEYSDKIESVKADREERDKQNKALREQTTDLLKQLREMKTKDDQRDIEFQKKLLEEEGLIKNKAKQEAEDASIFQIAQKEKQLQDLRKQLFEAQRKAEQGSQQTQGEVLELELEELLKREFPRDEIIPVAKGKHGADINQVVFDNYGHRCGTVMWESKRAQSWTEGWVDKLKGDQRNLKAEIAVIVTTVLPKDMRGVGQKDGVWITDFNSVIGLAIAFRTNLVQLTTLKLANVGKNEKMEVLFDYLTGAGFNQRIEAIIDAFRGMRSDLQKERDAYAKIWSKRETQINRVIESTAGMYGDLEGLTGQALPKIDILELPEGEEK